MLKKLKIKLILINIAIVSVILLIVFGTIYMLSARTEMDLIFRGLNAASNHIIGEEIEPDSKPREPGVIIGNYDMVFSTLTVCLDKSGNITEVYDDREPSEETDILRTVTKDTLATGESEGILRKHSLIYSCKQTSFGTVISYTSINVLNNRLSTTIAVTATALCGCLFLFFILSYFLAGIAIKPTERVWDEQKRFIQDASHDLKTPITVILANTEIVEAHSEDRVRDVTGWLESTKDEAERMKRLVQSMLELAKTDDLSEPLEIYDVDVSDLIEQTALQMEPLAFEKQINVETHIEPQLIAKSNGDSFTRIVHVLIDNGLKYAAKDTTLRISLTRERRGICFSVHNDGSFIKAEDIPHIFERFYRSDKARGKGGFGLGLSIAKSLCDKMKAEISCESSEEVGTTFTVTLPPTDKNPLTYFIKK